MKPNGTRAAASGIVLGMVALVLVVGLFIGMISGYKVWHRSQVRADASNRVKVTAINIRNAQQQAKVVAAQDASVKALADQRVIAAEGIRKAQDHISQTLTPLYVQWEAIQAQLKLAGSPNSTFIYLPSGANGVPLVSTLPTAQHSAAK